MLTVGQHILRRLSAFPQVRMVLVCCARKQGVQGEERE